MPGLNSVDVAIIGGGLAGQFIARQLKLMRPTLTVLIVEAVNILGPEGERRWKVGESTVEVAAHYMAQRLQLAGYLYRRQLPKNGLRFFFDNEDSSLELPQMSEIGSDHMPFHPSFQIDRARFERDLARMNKELGVSMLLGVSVSKVQLGDGGARHRIDVSGVDVGGLDVGGGTIEARWVVDASGRRHELARQLGLPIHRDKRLATAAAWGRYRGVKSLDEMGDEAWRKRVRFTSRDLSTNHFMYDGYWIWFIPLAGGEMSVGLVADRERLEQRGMTFPRTQKDFEGFLRGHRAVQTLLASATAEDFEAFGSLPFYTDQYFSTDRWAMVGEAGSFPDPFYSPGSDLIATANELATDLILRELDGEDIAERTQTFNDYFTFRYESVLRLYKSLYSTFGAFEVFRLKYLLDFNNYYNLVLWPFLAGRTADVEWLRTELRLSSRILQVLDTMAGHFNALSDHLRKSGDYHRRNEGEFINGLDGVGHLEPRLGPELDVDARRQEADRAHGFVLAAIIEQLTGREGFGARDRVINELDFPTVCLLKTVDDRALQMLLGRIGKRLVKELRAEMPSSGVERVRLDADVVSVEGPAEADLPSVTARAQALWDAVSVSARN